LVTLLGVVLSPFHEHVGAQVGTGVARILISEYRFRGPLGTSDEFVELFNAGTNDANVGGWVLRRSNNAPSSIAALASIPSNTTIRPGCFYLLANNGYAGDVAPDQRYVNVTADDGGIAIFNAAATIDSVGNGSAGAYGEGNRLPAFPVDPNQSYERVENTVSGYVDSNNNLTDFHLTSPATPHNKLSPCVTPNLTLTGATQPTHVEQGERVVVRATVSPATLPRSTNLQVTGDLSAIGGSTVVAFADDGIFPDTMAADNIFTTEVIVPQGNPLGVQPITLNVSDLQGRRATRNITVTVTLPALLYTPHEIQGAGATTPIALLEPVMVRGIVTARKANGFFLQTEIGMEDGDPATSEGVFVPATAAQLTRAQAGHVVYVKGQVAELVPDSDRASPPITAVSGLTFIFDIGERPLPPAVNLTPNEVSAAGTLDQLERFEGMRVHVASLMAVNGTGADGAFYAVLNGQARPFRTAGVEAGYPVLTCAADPAALCNVPVFDGNPERLRVDSDGLSGVPAVQVSTTAVMNDVTGPLDFESRTFTILPEVALAPVGGMSVMAAAPAAADQYTVASFSLGGALTGDRLARASAMVRNVLSTPDVVGVLDADNLAALVDLAAAIDTDAAAAGQPVPQYEVLSVEGVEAIDVHTGVLVKKAAGRVSALPAVQVGGGESIMVQATVTGPSTELPQDVTVIVTHLQSGAGSELDVLEQRKAEAEFLANFVQDRQSANPHEAIVLLGDFNAFEFNDGYVDTVGTILGHPAASDQVALASEDLVTPDLVNASNLIAAWARYSSTANGNAQALDHVLVSASLSSQLAGVARPRVNADFPDVASSDGTTPGRLLSDRDPMVAYFTFPPDVLAPVVNVPGDQTVEATGPEGAVVTFDLPTATDNLDQSVSVVCAPASGSVFALGNSGVTCSAQDVAGNVGTASFTVTVQDTTAPSLNVPSDITQEAGSPAGNAVSFDVTATDAVTASLTVTCSPASGSLFIGATTVQCSTEDAAHNSASRSFTVTVQDTTSPALNVPANITQEAGAAAGNVVLFDVTATDAVTPSPVVTCLPASGSTFPIGTTTVQCSAQDAAGHSASGSFTVTVRDTTAPVVTAPANMTLEANSPAGRSASFVATASDAVTTSLTVTCTPPSGMFPVGTTTVQCSTQDAAGNPASASFTVTVQDTIAPALTVPGNITGAATSAEGRVVSFTATATDAVTTSLTVDCAPSSGSTFAIGETVVTCAAADAAGNVATGSFTVTVTSTTAPPVFGHIAGVGAVDQGELRVWFAFEARESASVERGWVTLQVRGGPGRPGRYLGGSVNAVQMSDNPAYSPGINPKSGIDTVSFSGAGLWNGAPGYRFEITASDRGEPGRGRDTFSLTVFAPNGSVVESVSGVIRDGNIKSLR
jgi:hypothetical protein